MKNSFRTLRGAYTVYVTCVRGRRRHDDRKFATAIIIELMATAETGRLTLTHKMVDNGYRHDECPDQPIGHGQRRHEVICYCPKPPGRKYGEYN